MINKKLDRVGYLKRVDALESADGFRAGIASILLFQVPVIACVFGFIAAVNFVVWAAVHYIPMIPFTSIPKEVWLDLGLLALVGLYIWSWNYSAKLVKR